MFFIKDGQQTSTSREWYGNFIRPRKEQRVKPGPIAKGAECSAWVERLLPTAGN